ISCSRTSISFFVLSISSSKFSTSFLTFLISLLFSSRAFSNTSISKLISFIFLEEFIILFSTLFIFSLFSLIEVDASVVSGVNLNPLNVNVSTVLVIISVFFKNNSPFLILLFYFQFFFFFHCSHLYKWMLQLFPV